MSIYYRRFSHLNLPNNGTDAVNRSNILNHKEVTSNVPQNFQNQTTNCNYNYTNTIAYKYFSYKETLQDFNVGLILTKPCLHFSFNYDLSGHVTAGEQNIINQNHPW